MNNRIIKTVDEHNIDRDANVMFAFDLEGSEYVSYRISRDEEQDNLFVSKILKNIDGTFNMVNIDDSMEKSKLNSIVMSLVESAVKNPSDKLPGDSVSLSDGRMIKFISVCFNREQRIEVRKTYVTTVKKEVSRVAEKYYDVVPVVEQPKIVEDIFPTVTPVVQPVQEEVKVVMPEVVVSSTPVVESSVVESPRVEEPVVTSVPPVITSNVVTPVVPVEPVPTVVESITVPESSVNVVASTSEEVKSVQEASAVESTPIVPTPVTVVPEPVPITVSNESQGLVLDASKETNLNAALGEVASTTTIPVENISSVREFGVEAPTTSVVNSQAVVSSNASDEITSGTTGTIVTPVEPKKAGFANSKFFMLVAISFFLASCVFLGYEVFNYFQLTK